MIEGSNNQEALLNSLFLQLKPLLGFFTGHPDVMALIILVAGFVLAILASVLITRVVGRLARRTHVQWDDQLVSALQRPVFWSVLLVGILLAMLPLGLPQSVRDFSVSVVATLLIIFWSGFVLRLFKIVLRVMSRNSKEQSIVRPQTRPLFENLVFIVVLVVSVYLIFRSWDIDMTAWLASAGILGIAIGFAAKDTLANLFSGVFILADAPYNIGNYVVLESGERGKVTHIGIRSTRLLTRDDVEITIPNAIMGNTRIVNESGGPYEKFRIRVKVGVAYGSDIDQVKALLMTIAVSEQQVCTVPEPRVRFRAFGASGLDVELLCWVNNPELRGRVLDALNTTVYKEFNARGIEIPYSKQDVYIKELPEGR